MANTSGTSGTAVGDPIADLTRLRCEASERSLSGCEKRIKPQYSLMQQRQQQTLWTIAKELSKIKIHSITPLDVDVQGSLIYSSWRLTINCNQCYL